MSGLVFYNLGKRCYSPSDQKRGRLSLVSKGEEENEIGHFYIKLIILVHRHYKKDSPTAHLR